MTVYVDRLFKRSPKNPRVRRFGYLWCHLLADSVEELHDFAKELGLKKSYYRHKPLGHYDLTPNKQKLALKSGAEKISTREYLVRLRTSRKEWMEERERIAKAYVSLPKPERPKTILRKRGQGGAVILD